MLSFHNYLNFRHELKGVNKKIKKAKKLYKEVKKNPNDAKLYIEFRTSVEGFMNDELWASFAGPVPGYETLKHDYNRGFTKLDLFFFDAKLKLLGTNVKKMNEYKVPEFEDKINMVYAGVPFFRIKEGWKLKDGELVVDKEKQEEIENANKKTTSVNKNKNINKEKTTNKEKEIITKTEEIKNIEDDEELEM